MESFGTSVSWTSSLNDCEYCFTSAATENGQRGDGARVTKMEDLDGLGSDVLWTTISWIIRPNQHLTIGKAATGLTRLHSRIRLVYRSRTVRISRFFNTLPNIYNITLYINDFNSHHINWDGGRERSMSQYFSLSLVKVTKLSFFKTKGCNAAGSLYPLIKGEETPQMKAIRRKPLKKAEPPVLPRAHQAIVDGWLYWARTPHMALVLCFGWWFPYFYGDDDVFSDLVLFFLFFFCFEFQIIRFVISTLTPIFFVKIFVLPPPLGWDAVPGLCLFCCYQPLCVVSQQSCFWAFSINFPILLPPPPPIQEWQQTSLRSCWRKLKIFLLLIVYGEISCYLLTINEKYKTKLFLL